jgi:hypothetical protein
MMFARDDNSTLRILTERKITGPKGEQALLKSETRELKALPTLKDVTEIRSVRRFGWRLHNGASS